MYSATAAEPLKDKPKKSGPKPGQRHAGQFKKGYDPRRSGDAQKVALRREVSALCQEHTGAAVDYLARVLHDEGETTRSRIVAADMLLAYGHGRPVTREQHLSIVARVQGDSGGKPEELSDAQLLAVLQAVADASQPQQAIVDAGSSSTAAPPEPEPVTVEAAPEPERTLDAERARLEAAGFLK